MASVSGLARPLLLARYSNSHWTRYQSRVDPEGAFSDHSFEICESLDAMLGVEPCILHTPAPAAALRASNDRSGQCPPAMIASHRRSVPRAVWR